MRETGRKEGLMLFRCHRHLAGDGQAGMPALPLYKRRRVIYPPYILNESRVNTVPYFLFPNKKSPAVEAGLSA